MIETSIALGALCEAVGWVGHPANSDTVYRYVDPSSIDRERKEVTRPYEATAQELPSSITRIARSGDVLVSFIRPDNNVVALVPPSLDGAFVTGSLYVLRPKPERLDPHYLLYVAMGPDFVNHLVARTHGSTLPRVNEDDIRSVPVPLPLPSLDRQRHIAGLLSRASTLRVQHQDSEDGLRRLIVAALNRVCSVSDSMLATPRQLTLSDVATIVRGRPRPPESKSSQGDLPLLLPSDLQPHTLFIRTAKQCVDRRDAVSNGTAIVPPRSIVLVARSSRPLERVPVAFTMAEVALGPGLCAMIPSADVVSPVYLFGALLAMSPDLAGFARTGTNGWNLDIETLRGLEIAVTPRAVQQPWDAILRQLTELMHRTSARAERLDTLFSTLLDRMIARTAETVVA